MAVLLTADDEAAAPNSSTNSAVPTASVIVPTLTGSSAWCSLVTSPRPRSARWARSRVRTVEKLAAAAVMAGCSTTCRSSWHRPWR